MLWCLPTHRRPHAVDIRSMRSIMVFCSKALWIPMVARSRVVSSRRCRPSMLRLTKLSAYVSRKSRCCESQERHNGRTPTRDQVWRCMCNYPMTMPLSPALHHWPHSNVLLSTTVHWQWHYVTLHQYMHTVRNRPGSRPHHTTISQIQQWKLQ